MFAMGVVGVVAVGVLAAWAVGFLSGRMHQAWRPRLPKLGDTIRIGGRIHRVTRIEWQSINNVADTYTEPVDELLARTIAAGPDQQMLGELMVAQGWVPPTDSPWIDNMPVADYQDRGPYWLHWYDDPHTPREKLVGVLADVSTAELIGEALESLPKNIWVSKMLRDLRAGVESRAAEATG